MLIGNRNMCEVVIEIEKLNKIENIEFIHKAFAFHTKPDIYVQQIQGKKKTMHCGIFALEVSPF